jgi:hypothetical protein
LNAVSTSSAWAIWQIALQMASLWSSASFVGFSDFFLYLFSVQTAGCRKVKTALNAASPRQMAGLPAGLLGGA